MGETGETLDTYRRDLMLSRQLGLTKLYTLVHDPANRDAEIERLREIHEEIDEAVLDAYGWTDLDLGHGHHETPQGTRWTISSIAREEVLARLLELNHSRHHEEERQGIYPPKKGKKKRAKATKKATSNRQSSSEEPSIDGGLFKPDNALF